MSDKISSPGFYNLTDEQYHADPCAVPSLSNSIAKTILAKSLKHAWVNHPRLNPEWKPQEWDAKKVFGNVAHAYMTGSGPKIHLIDAANWQTKAAKQERDDALAAGNLPCLIHVNEQAVAMVKAAREQLAQTPGCEKAFFDGDGEQAMIWQEGETFFRSKTDWIEPRTETGHVIVYDYKTTGQIAAPHAISRHIYDMDYHMQHAFYERGLEMVIGDCAGKVVFRLVIQETEYPYLLSVIEIDSAGLTIGRKKVSAALSLWRRAMAEGKWPGYPRRIVEAEMPPWIESNWLWREEIMSDAGLLGDDEGLTRVMQSPGRESNDDPNLLMAG